MEAAKGCTLEKGPLCGGPCIWDSKTLPSLLLRPWFPLRVSLAPCCCLASSLLPPSSAGSGAPGFCLGWAKHGQETMFSPAQTPDLRPLFANWALRACLDARVAPVHGAETGNSDRPAKVSSLGSLRPPVPLGSPHVGFISRTQIGPELTALLSASSLGDQILLSVPRLDTILSL